MRALFSFSIFVFAALSGCASSTVEQELRGAYPLSKSRAVLEVSIESESDTHVTLRADHLARPIVLGASRYVVWAIPLDLSREQPRRVGAFTVDEELRGDFDATIALTDFWLVVTAERTAEGRAPKGPTLFSAEIRRLENIH